MMRSLSAILPLIAAAGLAACQTVADRPASQADAAQIATITGSLAYRERIALLPGAAMEVTLSDVSAADRPAPVLASQQVQLKGEQVPLPFGLSLKANALDPNLRYAVRATIRDSRGQLLWTTDTLHLIDAAKATQDMGVLNLVRVTSSDLSLLAGSWSINRIGEANEAVHNDPAITFTRDGKVNGSTGCNSFMGTYTMAGNAITIGPLATTRKACGPPLGDQEARMLAILGSAGHWNVDSTGRLLVAAPGTSVITATRR